MLSLLQRISFLASLFSFPVSSTIKSQATPTIILLPRPTAPSSYALGCHTAELTDHTRLDPLAPGPPQERVVVLSVFYPRADDDDDDEASLRLQSQRSWIRPQTRAEQARLLQIEHDSTSPYMPPITASFFDRQFANIIGPANLSFAHILTPCRSSAPLLPAQKPGTALSFPVLIFSPGLGAVRFSYTALAQALASQGYIVVILDHAYDSSILELANGTLIFGVELDLPEDKPVYIKPRVDDVRFVLDWLNGTTKESTSDELFGGQGIDVKRVGMLGHSLGGSSAATAMKYDSRIVGGVNLDGGFLKAGVSGGLDHPFLIFEREGRAEDASGRAFWEKTRGWKRKVSVAGTQHESFSDFPLLVELMGLSEGLPDEIRDILGTIGGQRVVDVQAVYSGAFFDMVLKGKEGGLFDGNSTAYPEVEVTK